MKPNNTKPPSGSTKQGNSPTHRVGTTTLAMFQLFSAHFPKQSRPKRWNRSCRRSRGSAGSGRRGCGGDSRLRRQRADGRAFTALLLRVLQHAASTSQRRQKQAASALLKFREAQDVRGVLTSAGAQRKQDSASNFGAGTVKSRRRCLQRLVWILNWKELILHFFFKLIFRDNTKMSNTCPRCLVLVW